MPLPASAQRVSIRGGRFSGGRFHSQPSQPRPALKTAAQNKNPPSFSEPTTFVTFLIGPVECPAKFVVHKKFACYHSPVLRAAFNSNSVEGKTHTYRLEDTTEEAFRLVVQWLYGQNLVLLQRTPNSPLLAGVSHLPGMAEDESLVELWVLADKLKIPKLQNAAIDSMERIRLLSGKIPSSYILNYAYQCTPANSTLRKYVLAVCALVGIEQFSMFAMDFSHELLIELACFLKERESMSVRDKQILMEKYHVPETEAAMPDITYYVVLHGR